MSEHTSDHPDEREPVEAPHAEGASSGEPERAAGRAADSADDGAAASTADGVDPAADVDVPAGAEAHECPHCGRRVPSADLLDLHRGLGHPDAVDDDEIEAFREAYDDEDEAITRFRIVAIGALVALYFGFLLTYVFVT